MLKLKLQYFGHLMQRDDSLEKTLMLGKIEGRRDGRYSCCERGVLGGEGVSCPPSIVLGWGGWARCKIINSLVLSLLYNPILTSIHDEWKTHSFDHMDLCHQSNVSAKVHLCCSSWKNFILSHWEVVFHPVHLYSFIYGHLDCFYILAVVNNAAVNIGIHISFQIYVFLLFR